MFDHCPRAVVMIDDFQVPFDHGYAYDDFYEAGTALNHAYIESAITHHGLQAFYPSVPASAGTGKRRGCVGLVKTETHFPVLTAETWMADEVAALGNGLVIKDYSAAAIVESILRAQRELPTLRAAAARAGRDYREKHGVERCIAAIASAF